MFLNGRRNPGSPVQGKGLMVVPAMGWVSRKGFGKGSAFLLKMADFKVAPGGSGGKAQFWNNLAGLPRSLARQDALLPGLGNLDLIFIIYFWPCDRPWLRP
jgi:hypothetical protein